MTLQINSSKLIVLRNIRESCDCRKKLWRKWWWIFIFFLSMALAIITWCKQFSDYKVPKRKSYRLQNLANDALSPARIHDLIGHQTDRHVQSRVPGPVRREIGQAHRAGEIVVDPKGDIVGRRGIGVRVVVARKNMLRRIRIMHHCKRSQMKERERERDKGLWREKMSSQKVNGKANNRMHRIINW